MKFETSMFQSMRVGIDLKYIFVTNDNQCHKNQSLESKPIKFSLLFIINQNEDVMILLSLSD